MYNEQMAEGEQVPVTPGYYTEELSNEPVKSDLDSATDLILFSPPAVIAGALDTFGQSFGLIDEADMKDFLMSTTGDFGDFYASNRDAARTAGDLASFVIPGTLAVKALQGARRGAQALGLADNIVARSVFTSGAKQDKLRRALHARDRYLARRRTLFAGRDFVREQRRAKYASDLWKVGASDMLKKSVAFELGITAAMNESDMFFPDDFSVGDQLLLAGLGVALPTGVETALLRKAARDSIKSAMRNTPSAFETGLEGILHEAILRGPSASEGGTRGVGVSLQATQRNLTKVFFEQTNDPILRSNLQSDIVKLNKLLRDQVEKMFSDNIDKVSPRAKPSKGQLDTVMQMLDDDPLALVGAQTLDLVPRERAALQKALDAPWKEGKKLELAADKQVAKGNLAEADRMRSRADYLKNLQAFIIDADGSVTLANQRASRFTDHDNFASLIRQEGKGDDNVLIVPGGFSPDARHIAIDREFIVAIERQGGKRRTFRDFNHMERSATFAGMGKRIANFERNNQEIIITKADDWLRLDAALTLRSRYASKDDVLKRVKLSPEWAGGWDEVEYQSLAMKYDDYVALAGKRDAVENSPFKVPDSARISTDDIRYALNIPGDEFGQVHPLVQLFETWRANGVKDLTKRANNTEEIHALMQNAVSLPEVYPFAGKLTKTLGANLEPAKGRPVLMLRSPTDPSYSYSREQLAVQSMARQAEILEGLQRADVDGALIVKAVFDAISTRPGIYEQAKQVQQLAEGIQSGRGIIGQQSFIGRDSPVLVAMNQAVVMSDRATEEAIQVILRPHLETLQQIRATKNAGSLLNYNQFVQSNRFGWQLAEETMQDGERTFFKLAQEGQKGKHNRELWQKWRERTGSRAIPEQMPDDALLPLMSRGVDGYSPLGLDDLSAATARSVTSLSHTVLDNVNAVRRLAGQREITKRAWHIPPERLNSDNHVILFRKGNGEFKQIFTGANKQEALRRAEQAKGPDDFIATPENIREWRDASIWDEPFASIVDYSDSLAQTGSTNKGGFFTDITAVGEQQLNGAVDSITNQLFLAARRTRGLMFEPQFNYAKLAQTAQVRKPSEASIFQLYNNTLFGNQALTPRTFLGGLYKSVESRYDQMLGALWARYATSASRAGTGEGGPKNLREVVFGPEREFKAIQKQLGEHSPFNNVEEFVRNTYRVTMPPSMKRHAAKLNQITSLLTLRMFEVGHSILNLTSLAATAPAVVRALKQLPGESQEEWKARIAAFGSLAADDIALFNPSRATVSAAHFMFTKEGRAVRKRAAQRGYFKQEVAELMNTLTASQEGWAEGMFKKGTDWVSFLSDRSEELARDLAFMVGYRVGQKGLKFQNEESLFAFAFDFANKTIGDYRPANRPQMFQGAVGMPLGLFQTFMWNYMQRLFGYVENKQWKAFATQMGMQQAVFGAESLPGWQQFTDIFGTNYDGTVDPITSLRERFGEDFTDLMLYGTLSNIPKIFADDGIAFYTRGTVDPKVTVLNPTQAPVANAIQNTFGAFRASIDQFRTGGQYSTQQMAEILAQYSISRPLKYAGEWMAGYSTDRRGQVISDDVRSGLAVTARILGSRRLYEAKMQEAYARQRSAEYSQYAIRDRLNRGTRAMIRDGKLTEDNLQEALMGYIKSGGNPAYFANWLRDSYITARTPKIQRRFLELIKRPGKNKEAMRLFQVLAPLTDNDPEWQ